jgi:hypothetical protein
MSKKLSVDRVSLYLHPFGASRPADQSFAKCWNKNKDNFFFLSWQQIRMSAKLKREVH